MEDRYARWLGPLAEIQPLSDEEIMGETGEEAITACFKEAEEVARAENRRLGLPEEPGLDPAWRKEAQTAFAAVSVPASGENDPRP